MAHSAMKLAVPTRRNHSTVRPVNGKLIINVTPVVIPSWKERYVIATNKSTNHITNHMNAKQIVKLANDIAITQQCIEDLDQLSECIVENLCSIGITLSAKIENPEPRVTISEDGSLSRTDRPKHTSLLAQVLGLEPEDPNDPSRPVIGGLRNIKETMALSIIGELKREAEERLSYLKAQLKEIQ